MQPRGRVPLLWVSTDMDVLVLENFVLLKNEQTEESLKERQNTSPALSSIEYDNETSKL